MGRREARPIFSREKETEWAAPSAGRDFLGERSRMGRPIFLQRNAPGVLKLRCPQKSVHTFGSTKDCVIKLLYFKII